MENCKSESVIYNEKEYEELLLTSGTGSPSMDKDKSPLHEDVGNRINENEWPLSGKEKVTTETVHQASLFDTYVSKTILSPGTKGFRPQFHSSCAFVLESLELLDPDFSQVVEKNTLLRENVQLNLEIGSSNSEIDKALELVLLDMNEGERSEVILCATKRGGKLKDQVIQPGPCIRCVINLGRVTNLPKFTNSSLNKNYLLSILNASTDDKYQLALNDKSCGIDLFRNGHYVDAFHRFSSGLKVLLTVETDDLSPSLQSLISTLCSNMAECQLKENNPSKAIPLCIRALDHDPCNVKALYRQASATWALGDTDQADSLLTRLLQLDPNNMAAQRLNCEVQVKIREYKDEYSKMMRRIFSG